jgi:hypothetical protein
MVSCLGFSIAPANDVALLQRLGMVKQQIA